MCSSMKERAAKFKMTWMFFVREDTQSQCWVTEDEPIRHLFHSGFERG